MKRPGSWLLLCGLFVLSVAGCMSSDWRVTLEKKAELRWPSVPAPLKVKYLGEIQGFTQSGESFFSFLAGTSERGKFGKPVAVAVGSDDRMAVADAYNKGVHLLDPVRKKYRLLLKTPTEYFESPVSLAFDEKLRLYIVDSALRKVFVFNPEGKYERTIQYHGKDAFGKNMEKSFGRPTAIACHKDAVFLVDTGTSQIHVYSTSGRYLSSFGKRGVEDGEFNLPTHIAIDPEGRIVVNDAMNFRIQVFDREGHFLGKFGSHGDGSGDFAMSKGVALDRWGIYYVVDTLFDTVQLFNDYWEFVLTVGSRGTGPGEFWLPAGLFIDHRDRLYVCDTYNHRIQVFQLFDINAAGNGT